MTTFAPGMYENPDWQRAPQFGGAVLLNNVSDAAIPVVHGKWYVGDTPCLFLQSTVSGINQSWRVEIRFYQNEADSVFVHEADYEGGDGSVVYDVLPVLAPWADIRLSAGSGAGTPTFLTYLTKTQSPAGLYVNDGQGLTVDQQSVGLLPNSAQTFHGVLTSPGKYQFGWFGGAGPGANVFANVGVFDSAGFQHILAEYNGQGGAGNWAADSIDLPGWQPFVILGNNTAGAVTMTATLCRVN